MLTSGLGKLMAAPGYSSFPQHNAVARQELAGQGRKNVKAFKIPNLLAGGRNYKGESLNSPNT